MAKQKKNKYGLGALMSKINSMSNNNALLASMGAGAVGSGIGALIQGGKTSGVGNAVGNIGGAAGDMISTFNPALGMAVKLGSGLLSGGINALAGSKINEENVALFEEANKAGLMFTSNASSFDTLSSDWGLHAIADFSRKDVGSDGLFSNKAKNLYNKLQEERDSAMQHVLNELMNNANTLVEDLLRSMQLNYAADGGKIHIKPNKRGTFTAAAKKRGMGVLEFASRVLANREDYSPAMVKKANFARNASKWHAFGGNLITQGGEFNNNGLVYIGNGGTHELNPFEGVPMGVDEKGVPNLVEEGEVLFNDYVFSNRLRVPKKLSKKYKLGGSLTYADAAKEMAKESEERPNDPISKNGVLSWINELIIEQEMQRGLKKGNRFAPGGFLSNVMDLAVKLAKELKENIRVPDYVDFNHPFRYAPVWGSVLGLTSSLLGKPDERAANATLAAYATAARTSPVKAPQISALMKYEPVDTDYLLNALNAIAGTTFRNAANTSGGNRATAMAGMLATGNNAMALAGNLLLLAGKENFENQLKVNEFNRATKQANALLQLDADKFNATLDMTARGTYALGVATAETMRLKARDEYNTTLAANATGLFENLGEVANDEIANRLTQWAMKHGLYLVPLKAKKGGLIKRRRGYTI